MTTTYDPAHLRHAADLLWKKGCNDAANILRTEADAIQKKKLEDDLHFKIGSHFRDLVKQRNGWTFNAVNNDEIRGFGKAAKDAVEAHVRSAASVIGSSPYTSRSGF